MTRHSVELAVRTQEDMEFIQIRKRPRKFHLAYAIPSTIMLAYGLIFGQVWRLSKTDARFV